MATSYDDAFPGEAYLREVLPDYSGERQMLVFKIVLAVLFWIIVAPSLAATEKTTIKQESGSKKKTVGESTESVARTANNNNNNNNNGTQPPTTIRVIDGTTNMCCLVCCLLHIVYLFFVSSPDNYYTGRTVFETPLFTRSECNELVEMAERVAGDNYERAAQAFVGDKDKDNNNNNNNHQNENKNNETERNASSRMRGYLDEPRGWQKLRHELYPTTDLNLVTDGFSEADRDWLREKLDARLAPTLERIFGIPPSSIRANDMFLIRYDGDRQASLSRHTDDGSVTFSVLLSDGFEGGGTRYWNRLRSDPNNTGGTLGSPFAYLLPEVGMMQTFPAMIQHEGVQTTRGRRYLLIGFLAVDKIDPWRHTPTGLSWFSSWGSFNWASTKIKEGKNAAFRTGAGHRTGRILDGCHKFLVAVCDLVFSHRFAVLVDGADADGYLRALDDAHAKTKRAGSSNHPKRASWFAGQQIDVNIDGTFSRNKNARENSDVDFDSIR
eukprot:jgi/Psemu1/189169/e_gw1.85.127.1